MRNMIILLPSGVTIYMGLSLPEIHYVYIHCELQQYQQKYSAGVQIVSNYKLI